MSTETLRQIDVNDAEKAVEWAERWMEDVARIPTRTARLLLKFATIGKSPAEVEELKLRAKAGEDTEEELRGQLAVAEQKNYRIGQKLELVEKKLADLQAGGGHAGTQAKPAAAKEADAV